MGTIAGNDVYCRFRCAENPLQSRDQLWSTFVGWGRSAVTKVYNHGPLSWEAAKVTSYGTSPTCNGLWEWENLRPNASGEGRDFNADEPRVNDSRPFPRLAFESSQGDLGVVFESKTLAQLIDQLLPRCSVLDLNVQ